MEIIQGHVVESLTYEYESHHDESYGDSDYQMSEKASKVIISTSVIVLFLYLLMSAAGIYNIIQFLIKQKRYRNLHLCYFYSLATVIVLARIATLIRLMVEATNCLQ